MERAAFRAEGRAGGQVPASHLAPAPLPEGVPGTAAFISAQHWIAPPLLRLMFLFVASYGLLYFSYKFYVPAIAGGTDFFANYYRMYLSPLDLTVAAPPAVYRQLSAIATHLVYQAGIYYPQLISLDAPGYDQRVFFAALFTNYLFLVLAAWIAGTIVQQELRLRSFVAPTMAGLLCLLSFHTQFSVITGLTEGLSWFMFALGFLFYLRRQLSALALVLALAVVQRELILILFAAIGGLTFLIQGRERRFYGYVVGCALACFVVYFSMRWMVWLPFPEEGAHINPQNWPENLMTFRLTADFVFQGLLSQNLLWLCVPTAILLARREGTPPLWLPVLLGSFLAIALVDVAAGEGNNLGRCASLLTPVFAAFLTISLVRLERA